MPVNTFYPDQSQSFNQILDLARQLPQNEKQLLADLLLLEDINISEDHKQLVRERIIKYNKHPELLIEEKQALKMIKNM